jgi:hypothetical protein
VDADRDQYCHSCGEILHEGGAARVRPGADERRFRRGRDWEEDEDTPDRFRSEPSGMGTSAIVVIVCGGLLLLLFVGIVLAVIFAQPTFTVTTGPGPTGANPPGFPINPGPPVVPNPAPPAPGGNPPPAPVAWEVAADPVPRPVKAANAGKAVRLQADNPHFILTSTIPGPFLASGENYQPTSKRAIWNLETMEKVSEVTGFRMAVFGSLSPDGRYLAAQLNAGGAPLVVIDCKDSKQAFQPQLPPFPPPDYYDFAGPRRLVVGTRDRPQYRYRVFEVPTGRQLSEVVTSTQPEENSHAVSGGGRYLAFKSGQTVTILDLDRGQPTGSFDIPFYRQDVTYSRLAFSPDGKELAVLMGVRNLVRVLSWDLAGNKSAVDWVLPTGLVQTM